MNLFKKKEKFLLLDVSRDKIGGLLISLDDRKNIQKMKSWDNLERHSSNARPPLIPGVSKVIAACDPGLAFKIFIQLVMNRDESSEPIGKVELENLIAQSVSKIFNHYRAQAGAVLGVDELDTILADSNVSGFEVDGHKVMNPLGFKPKEIRAIIEMTFTPRKTFNRVKGIKKNGDFFFTEKGQAQASVVKRTGTKKSDFLKITAERSFFYPSESSGPLHGRSEISWSAGNLISEISKSWSVSGETASGVYEYYVRESVSRPVDKYLMKIFSKQAKALASQVKKVKKTGKVSVAGEVPAEIIGKDVFQEVNLEDFSAKSGFNFDESDFGSGAEALRKLAPFFEFYYDNNDNEINGWLKRRLSWLGSAA